MSPHPTLLRGRAAGRLRGPAAVLAAILPAAVIAVALDAAVAAIAHGAGVSHHFTPLNFGSYAFLTVVGIGAGVAGWSLVRTRAADPARSLTRLVPVVLVLSFLPDLSIGIGKSMAATSWGGVAALMVMHLLVAAVALPAFGLFLPIERKLPT